MDITPASSIYFGKAATQYDEGRVENPVTVEDDAVIESFLFSTKKGEILVDLPCGTGRAIPIARKRRLNYVGIDISPDMITEANKKLGDYKPGQFILADARSLPLADGYADRLLSIKFIKWLPSDEHILETMREFRRVCRGSALVGIKSVDSNPHLSLREIKDRTANLVDRVRLGTSARSIKPDVFEKISRKAGWRIVSATPNLASNGIVINYTLV